MARVALELVCSVSIATEADRGSLRCETASDSAEVTRKVERNGESSLNIVRSAQQGYAIEEVVSHLHFNKERIQAIHSF